MEMDELLQIVENICKLGKENREQHYIFSVESFQHFFKGNVKNKQIIYTKLDSLDGKFTRREIIARYLLLSSVLDQGPDITGVELLLKNVVSHLYQNEIRILHRPLDFFKELNIPIDAILQKHEEVKKIRAEIWATENMSRPDKYNLFFAQSQRGIISINQVLDYSIHRWGVPLCMLLLLEKDSDCSNQPFIEYVEQFQSAEIFSKELKNHKRYGMGSAIGDKACHLFVKNYVSVLNLKSKKVENDKGWSDISYEVPLDSNAGRVLFRIGFVDETIPYDILKKKNVIKERKGKGGKHYIRVTNLRNIKVEGDVFKPYRNEYSKMIEDHFRTGSKKTMCFQRLPNFFLYLLSKHTNKKYSIADFDDGLIHIGTKYCFNHDNPKCDECKINKICKGKGTNIITDYAT